MKPTPNFSGLKATILHREDTNTEKLVRQLHLLGMQSSVQWSPLPSTDRSDVILVDADQGWDGLLPFGADAAPCPVVALLASEAPGRISWVLGIGAGAVVSKPVSASAIYPALVMAFAIHEERKNAFDRIRHLEERVRLRPLVHGAVERLMAAQGVDEEQAYRTLRNCAMQRRLPMEQVAAFILAGAEPLPKAI